MNNQTTATVATAATALGSIIVFVADQLGWEVSGDQAVILAGAFITILTAVVTYFHRPGGAE